MKNTLKALALGLAVASAPAFAGSVVGKVQTAGSVSITQNGMSQTVSKATAPYMTGSQVSTKTSDATLQVGAATVKLAPKTSLAVTGSAPLSVKLASGAFGTALKAGESVSISGVASPLTVTALTSGTITAQKAGKDVALLATSGKFVVTDASGVTRQVTAGSNEVVVAGSAKGAFSNVALEVGSMISYNGLTYVVTALAIGGGVWAVAEAQDTDDEPRASTFIPE